MRVESSKAGKPSVRSVSFILMVTMGSGFEKPLKAVAVGRIDDAPNAPGQGFLFIGIRFFGRITVRDEPGSNGRQRR